MEPMEKIVTKTGGAIYNALLRMNNGITIPQIGLGFYQNNNEKDIENAVVWGYEHGYRHFDTAAVYGNEASIAKYMKQHKIPREEIFITTKIRPQDCTYEGANKQLQTSLKNLDTKYIDLLLIHWPGTPSPQDRLDTWKAMEEAVANSYVRSIGVSNFVPHHLDHLLASAKIVPAVNQIEVHPLYFEADTIDYCNKKGILIEAYTPLAQGDPALLKDKYLTELANKYKKTVPQVALRWGVQNNFIILPKSKTKKYIQDNIEIGDFELEPKEVEGITKLNKMKKVGWSSKTIP